MYAECGYKGADEDGVEGSMPRGEGYTVPKVKRCDDVPGVVSTDGDLGIEAEERHE